MCAANNGVQDCIIGALPLKCLNASAGGTCNISVSKRVLRVSAAGDLGLRESGAVVMWCPYAFQAAMPTCEEGTTGTPPGRDHSDSPSAARPYADQFESSPRPHCRMSRYAILYDVERSRNHAMPHTVPTHWQKSHRMHAYRPFGRSW